MLFSILQLGVVNAEGRGPRVPAGRTIGITSVGSSDVTDILTDLVVTVSQGGNPIDPSGTIMADDQFKIEISFGVPVEGDDPTPENPVRHGDTAEFNFGNSFKTVTSSPIPLHSGTTLVGTATFMTLPNGDTVAQVVFNSDSAIFEEGSGYYNVACTFEGNFELNDDNTADENGEYTIKILETTYTVKVPPVQIDYTVTKTGQVNLADQSITWTVKVNAKSKGNNVDLAGYKFSDNLTGVGDFISGSFTVNGTNKSAAYSGGILSYTFPEPSIGEVTISFKTKIPDSIYYSQTSQTISNTAQLIQDETVVKTGGRNVTVNPKWITKSGVPGGEGGGGVYNPSDRTITWTITANEYGAALNNVVITDVLTGGLEFVSATLQKKTGTTWGTGVSIVPNTNGEYIIGNINTPVLLEIVTKVPDQSYTPGITEYSNSASIKWDGSGTGIGTGNIKVGIGYNSISKSGTIEIKDKKPTILWTINAEMRGQVAFPQIKIYDLLVYGTSIELQTATGFPSGLNTSLLTPQYNQKFHSIYSSGFTVFSNGSNTVTYQKHTIYDGSGNPIADLLEIIPPTLNEGEHLNTITFKYYSEIVNPAVYAGNGSSTIKNTASLFSANVRLNLATAEVSYTSDVLWKNMLKRGANSDSAAKVNDYTTNINEGFDYIDKSVIFRLNVNADGIDLPSSLNASLAALGDITLTDTLPAGWEFVPFGDNTMYMIFSGAKASGKTVDAVGSRLTGTIAGFTPTISSGTNTATFKFTNLSQPYVILVKARPTNGTLSGYFDDNKNNDVTNVLKLTAQNWVTGVSDNQGVRITSKILDKTYKTPESGVLKWEVVYNPYELERPGTRIEDELPLGADICTDSLGNLIIAGNIEAKELILNIDGTYSEGAAVTPP